MRTHLQTPPLDPPTIPDPGNLAIAARSTLVIYKYCLVTSAKAKFTDFQEVLHLGLAFPPTEVAMVEDTVAVLGPTQMHVFKVMVPN